MSVVLTALLNIGLRAFPDAGRRVARGLAELTSPDYDGGHERDRRLRVFVPWKAMIVGSVIRLFGFQRGVKSEEPVNGA